MKGAEGAKWASFFEPVPREDMTMRHMVMFTLRGHYVCNTQNLLEMVYLEIMAAPGCRTREMTVFYGIRTI